MRIGTGETGRDTTSGAEPPAPSEGDAMIVVGVAVACVAGWVVAPFVGMRRRGTLDEQVRAAIRAEARRVTATSSPSSTSTPLPPAVTVLPTPRTAPDETSPSPSSRATLA